MTIEARAIAGGTPAARSSTHRQIRGSSLLLAGRFLSKAINFGVQILIVRYLAKSDYGAFAYALSIVAVGETVVTFGLDRAVTRFIPIYHEQHEYRKLFGTLVLVVATMGSIGLSTVLAVDGLQAIWGGAFIADPQARAVLLILIFLSPIRALDTVLIGLFAVFASPRSIFFRKYVLAPCLKLAVVLALVLGKAGIQFLAFGYVSAGFVGVAIYTALLVRLLRRQQLLQRFSFTSIEVPWRTVLAFTTPLLMSDLVYVAMNATNTIILGYFRDTTEVATLRAVVPAAMLNQLVLASFATLFTPQAARMFARGDREGIEHLYWQTAVWVAVLSFPIFAVTFSLATPITLAVYGPAYRDSAIILTLLALGYYFNAALGPNGLTLKVCGQVRYTVYISLVTVVVNVAANLLLIPRYGAFGAAAGTAGTMVVHNLFKQVGLHLTGIQPFKPCYAKVYLVVGLAAAALLLVQLTLSLPLVLHLIIVGLASVLVLRLTRDLLDVERTMPEVMRIPVMAWLLGK